MNPLLIISAATELAGAVKEVSSKFPDYKEKHMENFFLLLKEIENEKVRPDRDHDDLLAWTSNKRLFFDTVVKEISSKG